MNNATRTRFDVFNKGEEPLTTPEPQIVDLTKEEVEEDLEVLRNFCGGRNGFDHFAERFED